MTGSIVGRAIVIEPTVESVTIDARSDPPGEAMRPVDAKRNAQALHASQRGALPPPPFLAPQQLFARSIRSGHARPSHPCIPPQVQPLDATRSGGVEG
jgi:hypothetical protein